MYIFNIWYNCITPYICTIKQNRYNNFVKQIKSFFYWNIAAHNYIFSITIIALVVCWTNVLIATDHFNEVKNMIRWYLLYVACSTWEPSKNIFLFPRIIPPFLNTIKLVWDNLPSTNSFWKVDSIYWPDVAADLLHH